MYPTVRCVECAEAQFGLSSMEIDPLLTKIGAVHRLYNSLKGEGASGICYMRYMRERGVFVLMLYNAIKFICICIIYATDCRV